jgi:hypothetical protein
MLPALCTLFHVITPRKSMLVDDTYNLIRKGLGIGFRYYYFHVDISSGNIFPV